MAVMMKTGVPRPRPLQQKQKMRVYPAPRKMKKEVGECILTSRKCNQCGLCGELLDE